ncbi:MAG: BamA/TamA family outer membrane protein [Candidatus Coatesbacteria bacterium]|nr:MAG: BamA/TamA family outer membrane protein [Candidatus Coatesbacteria bacterium]
MCYSVPCLASAQEESAEVNFVLGRVRVEGNKHFTDGAIRNLIGVEKGERYEQYNFDYLLEAGLAAVEAVYYGEGFESAQVTSELAEGKKNKRELKILVEEGPRAVVKEVVVKGVSNEHFEAVREELAVEVGAPLAAVTLNEAAVRVGDYYNERGYGRAKVKVEIDREEAAVTYTVEEGPQYHIDEVVVSGNEKTRAVIASREIDHKLNPSRLWRASKLDDGRANAYKTGLYRDLVVDVVDSERAPDLADVVVIVNEDKFRWFKIEPGYSSPDRVGLGVGWGHNNIFGDNERLSIETSFAYGFEDKSRESDGDITYVVPWLFGYRYKGTVTLYYERDVYEGLHEWEAGLKPRVSREITDNLEVWGGFNFERFRTEFDEPSEEGVGSYQTRDINLPQRYPETEAPQNLSSYILGITYDDTDDLFNPVTGTYADSSYERAGGFMLGVDLWRAIGDVRRYIRLSDAASVATRLHAGYVEPYGGTEVVPHVQRFVSGGAYSVRGYPEQGLGPQTEGGYALGGDILLEANVELRSQFPFVAGITGWEHLWGALFVDAGNVWPEWDEMKKESLRYGAGFGIRYNTVVGPVRFDVAWPVFDRIENRRGYIYLAFGHPF